MNIPKVIHYCWFGGNPLPELAIKCIESWKKFCPDYEIKEWNESNYDVNKCAYVKEAYEAKKWAFVSDYARYDILYQHGGLYFDTDVELIRPIDDIIETGAFMGMENDQLYMVNPGLGLGATKGMDFYQNILDFYNNQHFIDESGQLNTTTIVRYTTDLLLEHGLKKLEGIQCVDEIHIYPEEYFCPLNYETGEINITENTRSIHHFSQSWIDKEAQRLHKCEQFLKRKLGKKVGLKIARVINAPYRLRKKIKEKGFIGTLNFIKEKLG